MASYFTAVHQDAIVAFVAETDPAKREALWAVINPAFDKLAEYLCNYYDHSKQRRFDHFELKHDVVAFLFEKLDKFDPSKGSKAFSYFNVIGQNYVFRRLKDHAKDEKREVMPVVEGDMETWLYENSCDYREQQDGSSDTDFIGLLELCIAYLETRHVTKCRDHALLVLKHMMLAAKTDCIDWQKVGTTIRYSQSLHQHLAQATGLTERERAGAMHMIRKVMKRFAKDVDVLLPKRRAKAA